MFCHSKGVKTVKKRVKMGEKGENRPHNMKIWSFLRYLLMWHIILKVFESRLIMQYKILAIYILTSAEIFLNKKNAPVIYDY